MSMAPLAQRAASYHFFAFAASDTMDAIAERIERLVRTGRHMTLVRRYLKEEGSLEIKTGLSLETQARHGGIHRWTQTDIVGGGISVLCSPGIVGFGVSAYDNDVKDEEDAARKWHDKTRRREDVTTVDITGHGDGRDDRIVITEFNSYGVGIETTIAFDLVQQREKVAEQVTLLQQMAAVASHWDGIEFEELIKEMLDNNETAQQILDRQVASRQA